MTDTNLTRAEALERSSHVRVASYDVHVDLSDALALAPTFLSTTTVRFSADPGTSTWIDIVAPAVRHAVLNGVELDPASFAELLADELVVLEVVDSIGHETVRKTLKKKTA